MLHRILQSSSFRRNVGYFALQITLFLTLTPFVFIPAFGNSPGVPIGLAVAGGAGLIARGARWFIVSSRSSRRCRT